MGSIKDCDDRGICNSRNRPQEGFPFREVGPSTSDGRRANILHNRPAHRDHRRMCRHPSFVSIRELAVDSKARKLSAASNVEAHSKHVEM